MTENNQKAELKTFFIITIVIMVITSYIRYLQGLKGDMNLIIVLIHMWGPGIAAILTKLIHKGKIKKLGWKLGKSKYLILAYFSPVILLILTYGIVWLTGLGGVSTERLAELIRKGAPFLKGAPVFVLFLVLAIYGLIRNLISATGEEIGWTGFLTPAFLKKYSATKTSILIGIIWAVWHFPIILFAGYNSGTTVLIALPSFTIMIIGFSFIRTWLWIGSASLWTGAVLHASHNLFIQGFFDNLTIDTGKTKLFTTEFGVVTALIYILAAFLISYKFIKKK